MLKYKINRLVKIVTKRPNSMKFRFAELRFNNDTLGKNRRSASQSLGNAIKLKRKSTIVNVRILNLVSEFKED